MIDQMRRCKHYHISLKRLVGELRGYVLRLQRIVRVGVGSSW
ncbi:MAG: hypothetical protein C5S48_09425 [Candidatus Methanogaster sp.]|nr:MAG: hypothetical protein C5S48_09425 [ANME-2 cluster archaeon]